MLVPERIGLTCTIVQRCIVYWVMTAALLLAATALEEYPDNASSDATTATNQQLRQILLSNSDALSSSNENVIKQATSSIHSSLLRNITQEEEEESHRMMMTTTTEANVVCPLTKQGNERPHKFYYETKIHLHIAGSTTDDEAVRPECSEDELEQVGRELSKKWNVMIHVDPRLQGVFKLKTEICDLMPEEAEDIPTFLRKRRGLTSSSSLQWYSISHHYHDYSRSYGFNWGGVGYCRWCPMRPRRRMLRRESRMDGEDDVGNMTYPVTTDRFLQEDDEELQVEDRGEVEVLGREGDVGEVDVVEEGEVEEGEVEEGEVEEGEVEEGEVEEGEVEEGEVEEGEVEEGEVTEVEEAGEAEVGEGENAGDDGGENTKEKVQIAKFVLYKANTNPPVKIMRMRDYGVIDLARIGTEDMTVIAVAEAATAVRFDLDDQVNYRKESHEPFSVSGDITGKQLFPLKALRQIGVHTITAHPKQDRVESTPKTIHFLVVDSSKFEEEGGPQNDSELVNILEQDLGFELSRAVNKRFFNTKGHCLEGHLMYVQVDFYNWNTEEEYEC